MASSTGPPNKRALITLILTAVVIIVGVALFWIYLGKQKPVGAQVERTATPSPKPEPTRTVIPGDLMIEALTVNNSCHDLERFPSIFPIAGRTYNLKARLVRNDGTGVSNTIIKVGTWDLETDNNGWFWIGGIRFETPKTIIPAPITLGPNTFYLEFDVKAEPVDEVGPALVTSCDMRRALQDVNSNTRKLIELTYGFDLDTVSYEIAQGPCPQRRQQWAYNPAKGFYGGIDFDPEEKVYLVAFNSGPLAGGETCISPNCGQPDRGGPQETPTPGPSPTPKPSLTPGPTATETLTPVPSETPLETPTGTPTPVPSETLGVLSPTPTPQGVVKVIKYLRAPDGGLAVEGGVTFEIRDSNCETLVVPALVSSAGGETIFAVPADRTYCVRTIFPRERDGRIFEPVKLEFQESFVTEDLRFVVSLQRGVVVGIDQTRQLTFQNRMVPPAVVPEGERREVSAPTATVVPTETPVPAPIDTPLPSLPSPIPLPPPTATGIPPTAAPSVTPTPCCPEEGTRTPIPPQITVTNTPVRPPPPTFTNEPVPTLTPLPPPVITATPSFPEPSPVPPAPSPSLTSLPPEGTRTPVPVQITATATERRPPPPTVTNEPVPTLTPLPPPVITATPSF